MAVTIHSDGIVFCTVIRLGMFNRFMYALMYNILYVINFFLCSVYLCILPYET